MIVLYKSVCSTKHFIRRWLILNLVNFRGQHWRHATNYVISSVLSPFVQLSHKTNLLGTVQCCPSCSIHGVLNTQRKFTLPMCLDAAFPILNSLLVLLLLLLLLLFQSHFNTILYIIVQQYIDINIKLIYFISTIDKPHNNSVYVLNIFTPWRWLWTVAET